MGPGTIRCLAHSALPMLGEAVRLVPLAVIRSSDYLPERLCPAWMVLGCAWLPLQLRFRGASALHLRICDTRAHLRCIADAHSQTSGCGATQISAMRQWMCANRNHVRCTTQK